MRLLQHRKAKAGPVFRVTIKTKAGFTFGHLSGDQSHAKAPVEWVAGESWGAANYGDFCFK
jgi:hypothetical protein